MRSIISQNTAPLRLPDFRNLGTILRVLLAVNAVAFVAAWVAEPAWEALPGALAAMAAVVEPQLLLLLLLLYVLQPWFADVPWATGAWVAAAATVIAGLVVHAFLDRLLPQPSHALLRRTVFSLLLFATLLGYFRLRAKALSPAISEARLQALQARIRPHFLFNSINAVLSLIRSEPARAEQALEDLADLFRVLMRDNRELAPLADEVELCRQYLALEALRLGERLQVEWHLNSMPDDALVPPLVLQPLLENAVYHGIEPAGDSGTIRIGLMRRGDALHLDLANPCSVGADHQHGNHMALDNLRERLALYYDLEARLDTGEVLLADGRREYRVHIVLPCRGHWP